MRTVMLLIYVAMLTALWVTVVNEAFSQPVIEQGCQRVPLGGGKFEMVCDDPCAEYEYDATDEPRTTEGTLVEPTAESIATETDLHVSYVAGYTLGVLDSHNAQVAKGGKRSICVPAGVTNEEIALEVLNYLEREYAPTTAACGANAINEYPYVMFILSDVFDCRGE